VTVVRINAITVEADRGEELASRFAARAGAVDRADGFEGFELLRPTDGRDTWLVVTRWRDEEAFRAWVASPAFAHGHRAGPEPTSAQPSSGGRVAREEEGHDSEESGGTASERPAERHPADHAQPMATASELWSYDVVDLSSRSRSARG
jgi:heme oxygenase (mycobilin-producing)